MAEYGRSRFKDFPDEQTAKELGKRFASWASAKNSGLYVDFADGVGFRSPATFPESLLQVALKMGDELARDIRSRR